MRHPACLAADIAAEAWPEVVAETAARTGATHHTRCLGTYIRALAAAPGPEAARDALRELGGFVSELQYARIAVPTKAVRRLRAKLEEMAGAAGQ